MTLFLENIINKLKFIYYELQTTIKGHYPPHHTLIVIIYMIMVNYSVQAQSFQSANIPEDVFPSISTYASHTSAYSLSTTGNNFLFVHTWDDTDNYPTSSGGIAVREVDITTSNTLFESVILLDDIASLEAVIVEDNGDFYIVATYYDIANQEFTIDIYEWDNINGPAQVTGYPQNIAPFLTNPDFDWIRLDAIDRQFFGIVWSSEDSLYAAGGDATNSFTLSNPLVFDPHSDFPNGYTQPDIALSVNVNSDIRAFIVVLDAGKQYVACFYLDFINDILSATTGTPPLNQSISSNLYEYQTSGEFFLPRIDALDNSPSADYAWSYVVRDHTDNGGSGTYHDYIHAYIYDAVSIYTDAVFTLNNGNVVTGDISFINHPITTDPQINSKPVVALEEMAVRTTGETVIGIYYGWYHQHGDAVTGLSANDDAYLGLKLTSYAFPLWGNNYYVIPDDPDNISPFPSLAFSGNNDPALDGLYMAFTQENATSFDINIGCKTVPWGNGSFRPAPVKELEQSAIPLNIYPNPFTHSFTIRVIEGKDEIYNLNITDLIGRNVLQLNGTISELNNELRYKSTNWQNGQYILQLKNESTGELFTSKLTAINN